MAGGRIETVGIGVPGSVDRATGRVSMGNSTWLHGRDLRGDLAAALERPVKIANDANCFALSEAVDGAGAGAQVVFGVILGTGVGGGVVAHGRLIEGINAIGGEWGHIPLPSPLDDERPGPLCSCGVAGHTEAWLSGPNFAADYARRAGLAGRGRAARRRRSSRSPRPATRPPRRACAATRTASAARSRSSSTCSTPTSSSSAAASPTSPASTRTCPRLIEPHVFGDKFNTRLVPNVHGDSSGVRGAAWL